ARTIGHTTSAGCQHHRDGIIVFQLFERAQHFTNCSPVQSVSFFRPVNRDFCNGPALLHKNVLSLHLHQEILFSRYSPSRRITPPFYPCQPLTNFIEKSRRATAEKHLMCFSILALES